MDHGTLMVDRGSRTEGSQDCEDPELCNFSPDYRPVPILALAC